MTKAARKVLEDLESLPDSERDEITAEILRRAVGGDSEAPSDNELVAAADSAFLELDRREGAG